MANVPISAFTVPANTVGIGATGYSLTGSASASFMDLAGTWNTSGTPTAIKLNITDTASNAASLLMDLRVGGSTRFNVLKSGYIRVPAAAGIGGGALGSAIAIGTASGNGLYLGSDWAGFQIGGGNIFVFSTNQFVLGAPTALSFSSQNFPGFAALSPDASISRRGPANLRLGAADAAAPVAQTLSVQSVVAGTTNTAGANFTITGSQGTGTGAGGSLIFQVAPAGSSGTAQNALANAFEISGTGTLTNINSTGGFNSTLNLRCGSGSGIIQFNGSGVIGLQANTTIVSQKLAIAAPGTLSGDTWLWRDAANILALRNDTAAQEFRVYETTTGTIYKAILGNRGLMKISGAAFADGAGAQVGTLTNAPAIGNPTKWISIDDNGTTRYIPAW